MSQAGLVRAGGGGGTPIETLTGNTGGPVGPDGAFNINLPTGVGLNSAGNPGTNTITFTIENADEGTTTTVGAVTSTIISIPMGATPSTITLEARIAGFESTTPAGAGFQLFGVARTDGATATIIGTPDVIANQDVALNATDLTFVASGNNVNIVALGEVGLTISWRAFSQYTRAP